MRMESIVHVEGMVTGSTAAVTVRISLDMVSTVATACLGLLLLARSRVVEERGPKENHDEKTQFRLQLGTPCSNGDTWMLATCRPVEIVWWDRGDDGRAKELECYGGVTLAGGQVE